MPSPGRGMASTSARNTAEHVQRGTAMNMIDWGVGAYCVLAALLYLDARRTR